MLTISYKTKNVILKVNIDSKDITIIVIYQKKKILNLPLSKCHACIILLIISLLVLGKPVFSIFF